VLTRARNTYRVGAVPEHAPDRPGTLRRLKERSGAFSSIRMPDLTDWWVGPATRAGRELAQTEGPFDAVISTAGPYTAHLVARRLVRAGAARTWVADFRDLWTANPVFRGLPVVRTYERRLERAVLGEADLVTTVSPELADAFRRDRRSGRGRDGVEIVYNGYTRDVPHTEPPTLMQQSPGLRLVHTGRIYDTLQDPRPVCAALGLLRDRGIDARLHIAGTHPETWRIAAIAEDTADLLVDHGQVPHARAVAMQRAADVLLMLGFRRPGEGSLPGKLFEYLVAEAPVLIVGEEPDAAAVTLITETGSGARIAPEPGAIADAIGRARPTPRDPERVRVYDRRNQSLRLLELIRAL